MKGPMSDHRALFLFAVASVIRVIRAAGQVLGDKCKISFRHASRFAPALL
jgi:hypothetical protein